MSYGGGYGGGGIAFPLGIEPNTFDAGSGDRTAALALLTAQTSNIVWASYYNMAPGRYVELRYVGAEGATVERLNYQNNTWVEAKYVYGIRGLPGDAATVANLEDGHIPVKATGSEELISSGIQVTDKVLVTPKGIKSAGKIESDVNTFSLGGTHDMSAGGQNVEFINNVTGLRYHPLWQSADESGDWLGTWRKPTSELRNYSIGDVGDILFSNPTINWVPLNSAHRLYKLGIVSAVPVQGVDVTVEVFNGSSYVPYFKVDDINIAVGSNTYSFDGILDLHGNESLKITFNKDVTLLGDTSPAVTFYYRLYEDVEVITEDSHASSWVGATESFNSFTLVSTFTNHSQVKYVPDSTTLEFSTDELWTVPDMLVAYAGDELGDKGAELMQARVLSHTYSVVGDPLDPDYILYNLTIDRWRGKDLASGTLDPIEIGAVGQTVRLRMARLRNVSIVDQVLTDGLKNKLDKLSDEPLISEFHLLNSSDNYTKISDVFNVDELARSYSTNFNISNREGVTAATLTLQRAGAQSQTSTFDTLSVNETLSTGTLSFNQTQINQLKSGYGDIELLLHLYRDNTIVATLAAGIIHVFDSPYGGGNVGSDSINVTLVDTDTPVNALPTSWLSDQTITWDATNNEWVLPDIQKPVQCVLNVSVRASAPCTVKVILKQGTKRVQRTRTLQNSNDLGALGLNTILDCSGGNVAIAVRSDTANVTVTLEDLQLSIQ